METLEIKDYLSYLRKNNQKLCLTFCNRKGGVGKTCVSLSFAKVLADNGFDVCMIDADPQQSLSNILGVNNAYENNPILNFKNLNKESKNYREKEIGDNYYIDDLTGEKEGLELFTSKNDGFHRLIKSAINGNKITKEDLDKCFVRPKMIVPKLNDELSQKINNNRAVTLEELEDQGFELMQSDIYGFDLLPSSEEMADDEIQLLMHSDSLPIMDVFKIIINAIKNECDYDAIVIDTPPSLGVFSVNAIRAADGCVIVGMPDKQSVYSLAKIKSNIRELKSDDPSKSGIVGFVMNACKDTDMLKPIMEHYVKEELNIKFFDTLIPKTNSASKASSTGLAFVQYDKKVLPAYQELTKEILQSYFDMVGWDEEREEYIFNKTIEILKDDEKYKEYLNISYNKFKEELERKNTSIKEYVDEYGKDELNKTILNDMKQIIRKEILKEKNSKYTCSRREAKYHKNI